MEAHGFAFVTFQGESVVGEILMEENHIIEGKKIITKAVGWENCVVTGTLYGGSNSFDDIEKFFGVSHAEIVNEKTHKF